jgi:hypothetical protein
VGLFPTNRSTIFTLLQKPDRSTHPISNAGIEINIQPMIRKSKATITVAFVFPLNAFSADRFSANGFHRSATPYAGRI